ncbi:MAG TPA: glycosyltransferase [Anaerolineae bacterium]|nr:glycosyltransferase [Anaerolineae bacterium]
MTMIDHTFSVIVNTTDRANSLSILLRALEQQSYPYFEVVIVVGPTQDHTMDVLAEYNGRVRIRHCKNANLSQSRNIGLLAARGDIVAYIDDDAVPGIHWLAQLNRLFQDPRLDGTGGMVYMIRPRQPLIQHRIGIASALAEQVDVRQSYLEDIVPPGQGKFWTGRMMGTNMAYRRRALLEIGGFDEFFEWLYDDSSIALRLTHAGKIVHPVKEAVVYHVPASSRNRVTNSYNARWWVQTKSVIYFTQQYGPEMGESQHDLLMRSLHYAHGHWLWAGQLQSQGRLTRRQAWKMRAAEVKSAVIGACHGRYRPPQLLAPAQIEKAMQTNDSIQPYLVENSTRQPAVNPVSGQQPNITLTAPPLRVCLLSAAYPPFQYEGVGRHTNLMARGLFELGHTVHVITHGEKEAVSFYDGAYVHQVPHADRYGRYCMFAKLYYALNHSHAVHDKVQRLILNDGIQIVDSPLWQFDGLVTAVHNRLPVVVRLQTALRQITAIQQDSDADTRLVGEMEEEMIRRAAYLVPNSQATVRKGQAVYGIQFTSDRYTIIPHGIVPVDDEAIRPFDPDNSPDTLTVLYLGRLEKRKGIQDLFQAIPAVLEKVPRTRFIIAGADNSHRDGFQQETGLDYAAYFSRHYAKYAKNVTFLGRVSEEKLHELYQTCDLFVAPSLYESFGIIYLEAMNYAKPVIGCRAGGIPEVVAHGENGLLVEPEAPDQLAEAINQLLQSPAKLRDMGLAGRQRLLNKFTYIQMARQFATIYRQTINQYAARNTE